MSSEPSIKKNFAYKSALTLSSYIIGFITFPYVSRVLGVERLGLVNFVDNTINYFLLFATLGVSLLGTREIAAVKNDRRERSRVFSNILGMNLAFTALTLVVYSVVVLTVPKLSQYSELFFIGAAKILSTAFLVEWFFTGIEDFRYITIRSLAVKLLYVAAVFVFVRTPGHYKLYFVLTVGMVVLNALINAVYVRRFADVEWRELPGMKYLKQNCILGIYSIMTSMYLTFNVMFLGLVSDNVQVGYYTTAFKIYTVILGFFAAFTNVMLPRMSALLADGEQERFRQLIDKSFRAMCTFSVPLIVCTMILAPQIVLALSGAGYEGAVTPMRIIMPAALFVGIAQVLAIQVLAPMKRDRTLFTASVLGAAVAVVINLSIVPRLQSTGSAVVLLCSEITVTTTYIVYVLGRRLVPIPFGSLWRNVLLSAPAAVVCLLCSWHIENEFVLLAVAVPVSVAVWMLCKYIFTRNRLYV